MPEVDLDIAHCKVGFYECVGVGVSRTTAHPTINRSSCCFASTSNLLPHQPLFCYSMVDWTNRSRARIVFTSDTVYFSKYSSGFMICRSTFWNVFLLLDEVVLGGHDGPLNANFRVSSYFGGGDCARVAFGSNGEVTDDVCRVVGICKFKTRTRHFGPAQRCVACFSSGATDVFTDR